VSLWNREGLVSFLRVEILASAIPCACDYAEPCALSAHVEEANGKKVGAL
jgi:hypothetical protein